MDPKWLNIKSVAQEGCNDRHDAMIGHIGLVSQNLGSLLGAIEFAVLCALVCKVRYLTLKLRRLYYTSREFNLLAP